MRWTHFTATAAILVAAIVSASPGAQIANVAKQQSGRYLIVTNATFDSVTELSIAPDGTDVYRAIDIGEPLQGGETSITVDVPPGGCFRTMQAIFRDGHSQHFPHIDLCRSQHLRLTTGGAINPNEDAGASN